MNQSSNNQDDDHLIRQTLAGESSAFESLIEKYQNRLFHSMTQVLRNSTDAEDIVQDAFVKAFSKLNTFRGGSQFYTWLYRIAHNSAISQIRKRKPTESLDHDAGVPAATLEGHGVSPSQRIEQQEQSQQLNDALGRLKEEQRRVLVLREMEGLDYDAIAEILDVPVGTVRSRLHRARTQLKEELERQFTDTE
jgi:RNA polymerase sigma-70 factor (ECF subfamily)